MSKFKALLIEAEDALRAVGETIVKGAREMTDHTDKLPPLPEPTYRWDEKHLYLVAYPLVSLLQIQREAFEAGKRVAALSSPTIEQSEREAFETWAKPRGYRCVWQAADGVAEAGYTVSSTHQAWEAWHASATSGRPRVSPPVSTISGA